MDRVDEEMSDPPVVLIIEDEPDLADLYTEWLEDGYEIRTAIDAETAGELFDETVDVVLLDRQLPDASGEGLLGRLRDRDGDFAAAMITGIEPDFRILKLDVNEYLTKPVDRNELRALVGRLEERNAVEAAISEYLSLLGRKRSLEAELSEAGLESDPRYESLSGELLARRRQIESLLVRLEESDVELPSGAADDADKDETNVASMTSRSTRPPIYRSRPSEFYGLWLLAALTYGVGDILSTLYAVFGVPGIDEANPVVDAVLANFGVSGFLVLKLLVFLLLISVSVQGARTNDRFSYYWPPLLMTVLGLGLTLWNLSLIAGIG